MPVSGKNAETISMEILQLQKERGLLLEQIASAETSIAIKLLAQLTKKQADLINLILTVHAADMLNLEHKLDILMGMVSLLSQTKVTKKQINLQQG